MLFSASLVALLLPAVLAHPGHDVAEEAAERAAFLKLKPRTVESCKNHISARSRESANIARRHDLLKNLRAEFLRKRDFAEYNFTHEYTGSEVTADTDPESLLSVNASCTLAPDVTQGPYYVNGELIRQDLRETQEGVLLYLDLEFLDTTTCEPVSDLYIDAWHANATGVYSGIVASGNGNDADSSNINTTFLRGIQQTDSDGIVQFITIVPGHYTGRAPHIHVLSHAPSDVTVLSNDTLESDSEEVVVNHVGQLFFDQSLLTEVGEVSPYTENTQDLTLNSDDSILSEESDSIDPFVEYALIGDTVADGLVAWITIGLDSNETDTVDAAATYYASGGVEYDSSSTDSTSSTGSGGPDSSNSTSSNSTSSDNSTFSASSAASFASSAASSSAASSAAGSSAASSAAGSSAASSSSASTFVTSYVASAAASSAAASAAGEASSAEPVAVTATSVATGWGNWAGGSSAGGLGAFSSAPPTGSPAPPPPPGNFSGPPPPPSGGNFTGLPPSGKLSGSLPAGTPARR